MEILKKNIKDYDLEELKTEFTNLGEKPYRAEQVFKWIHQENVASFDEMTNISLDLRKKLSEEYDLHTYKIIAKLESKDGTKKYLFDVLDGNAIETVLMEYKHRKINLCINTNWMQNGM